MARQEDKLNNGKPGRKVKAVKGADTIEGKGRQTVGVMQAKAKRQGKACQGTRSGQGTSR
jgi:hypothetical protein